MKKRELYLKNFVALRKFLTELSVKHRYWDLLRFAFWNDLRNREITLHEKGLLLTELKQLIQEIKNSTDLEFFGKQEDSSHSLNKLIVLFHEPLSEVRKDKLMGNLMLVEKVLDVNEGKTATIELRVKELVNGQWVDRGLLEDY